MLMLSPEQVTQLLQDISDLKANMQLHMRRTDLAEENVSIAREEIKILHTEVKVLHDAHTQLKTMIMLIGWIAASSWPILKIILEKFIH